MDRSFDDVIGHPWARNHLETLYSKGMMQSKEANRFVTNEPITRGEFASLLVRAFEIPLDYEGQGTFTDVREVDPYSFGLYEYKYIETAARVGIVRGSLGGRFLPRENITREDAAVMIARAADLKLESDPDRARQRLEREFTDAHNFDAYAIPSVVAVARADLIEGKPNVVGADERRPTYYFDPKANFTRAEAAAVMMRVLLQEKRIPSM
nr:S-layer homology domain-containing protein [Caldalkalibacillus salinus]